MAWTKKDRKRTQIKLFHIYSWIIRLFFPILFFYFIFFLFYFLLGKKNPKRYFSVVEFKRKHLHPSFVIFLLQLLNICAACSTSKTHSRTHWGRHHPSHKCRKTPCTRKFGEYIFFTQRIHCKWRNIKTLRTRTAIFLYHKTSKSSWDNTELFKINLQGPCTCMCAQQHTHIH